MTSCIYIAGRMHCGSTILDTMLGTCANVFNCGELVNGLSRGESELCACGSPLRHCEFWSGIINPDAPPHTRDDCLALLASCSDIRQFPSALLHALTGWPAAWNRYRQCNSALLTRIGEWSGKACILDSGKEFTRALMIARFAANARVLHLVRNPVSTVASYYWRQEMGSRFYFMKRSYSLHRLRFPALMLVAISWNVGIVAALLMQWVSPRNTVLHVSYEKLCRDPAGQLRRIGEFCGIDVSYPLRILQEQGSFGRFHRLAGNLENQSSGEFRFIENSGGRRDLPPAYAIGTAVLTFPFRLLARALLS